MKSYKVLFQFSDGAQIGPHAEESEGPIRAITDAFLLNPEVQEKIDNSTSLVLVVTVTPNAS